MGTLNVCVLLGAAFTRGWRPCGLRRLKYLLWVRPVEEECADPWNRRMTRVLGTDSEPRELSYFSLSPAAPTRAAAGTGWVWDTGLGLT